MITKNKYWYTLKRKERIYSRDFFFCVLYRVCFNGCAMSERVQNGWYWVCIKCECRVCDSAKKKKNKYILFNNKRFTLHQHLFFYFIFTKK